MKLLITGAPGSGKSTKVARLGLEFLAFDDHPLWKEFRTKVHDVPFKEWMENYLEVTAQIWAEYKTSEIGIIEGAQLLFLPEAELAGNILCLVDPPEEVCCDRWANRALLRGSTKDYNSLVVRAHEIYSWHAEGLQRWRNYNNTKEQL